MNLYSRKIIGWAYSTTMTAELALKTVENAYLNINDPTIIIFHRVFEDVLQSEKSDIRIAEKVALMIMLVLNPSIHTFTIKERRGKPQNLY